MRRLARQLLVEFYDCNREIIDSIELVKTHVVAATGLMGATISSEAFSHFSPRGVSGAVISSGSHITVHTIPEQGYVALDVFTYGRYCDPWKGFKYLREIFEAGTESVKEVDRGLPDPDLSELTPTTVNSSQKNSTIH